MDPPLDERGASRASRCVSLDEAERYATLGRLKSEEPGRGTGARAGQGATAGLLRPRVPANRGEVGGEVAERLPHRVAAELLARGAGEREREHRLPHHGGG